MTPVHQIISSRESTLPITEELTFLRQQTGEDEVTILIQALHVGINSLYCQTVEQLFIDGNFPRDRALDVLGRERVTDLEYAQQALAHDIQQGLRL